MYLKTKANISFVLFAMYRVVSVFCAKYILLIIDRKCDV